MKIIISSWLLLTFALSASASPWTDGTSGITTTGKVGVGTTAPAAQLQVKAANYQALTLESGNADTYITLTGKPTGTGRFAFNSWGGASGFVFGSGDPSANGFGTAMLRLQNYSTSGGMVLPNAGAVPEYAIRGNSDTWLFGYSGVGGAEDISIGTQDNSGTRSLTLAAGGKARMRMLGDGSVGIGTDFTTGGFALNVTSSSTYKQFRIRASGTGGAGEPLMQYSGVYNSGNGAQIWQDASGNFRFNTNPNQNAMLMTPTGDIGMGTYTPGAKLDVTLPTGFENLVSMNQNGKKEVQFQAADNGKGGVMMLYRNEPADGAAGAISTMIDARTYKPTYFNAGNVGIGTSAPTEKLEVAGNIKATGIKISKLELVPDYVFEKGYKLQPLDQVESFVKKNKHLPEVPSASQLNKDGLDLASMNLKLLRKVEELTLHVIEQDKRIKALERR